MCRAETAARNLAGVAYQHLFRRGRRSSKRRGHKGGWLALIGTLLHELRHIALYECKKQPYEKGIGKEKKHPLVPGVGLPTTALPGNPDNKDRRTWKATQDEEAAATVAAAEKAAADAEALAQKIRTPENKQKANDAKVPWNAGHAGDSAKGH